MGTIATLLQQWLWARRYGSLLKANIVVLVVNTRKGTGGCSRWLIALNVAYRHNLVAIQTNKDILDRLVRDVGETWHF